MAYLVRHFYKYRGLVKWYDRGLQNLWWEFDSLIPCSIRALKQLILLGFKALIIIGKTLKVGKGFQGQFPPGPSFLGREDSGKGFTSYFDLEESFTVFFTLF